MQKYFKTIEIVAEQFLPNEDKIPEGVTSDGLRSPRTDPRSKWVLLSNDGLKYLADGDYVITDASGERYVIQKAQFEEEYKLMEG
jgi:hypothetical protein